jgi:hypothetical protein
MTEQIQLSAWQFGQNIGKTTNAITAALKANNMKVGPRGGQYSLRDLESQR